MVIKVLFFAFILFCSFTLKAHYTVGTYNLKGLSDLQNLKKDFANLPQVQVWALQEVNVSLTEDPTLKILQLFKDKNWYVAFEFVNKIDETTWEGQAIVSRLPILNHYSIPLEATSEKKRLALAAEIKDLPFLFINTDHEVNIWNLGFKDRLKQIEKLLAYTQGVEGPVVITGDFNSSGNPWLWNNAEEVQWTKERFEKSNFQMSPSSHKQPYTFNAGPIYTQIDLLFYRAMVSTPWKRLEKRQGSDHYPIFMTLEVTSVTK